MYLTVWEPHGPNNHYPWVQKTLNVTTKNVLLWEQFFNLIQPFLLIASPRRTSRTFTVTKNSFSVHFGLRLLHSTNNLEAAFYCSATGYSNFIGFVLPMKWCVKLSCTQFQLACYWNTLERLMWLSFEQCPIGHHVHNVPTTGGKLVQLLLYTVHLYCWCCDWNTFVFAFACALSTCTSTRVYYNQSCRQCS